MAPTRNPFSILMHLGLAGMLTITAGCAANTSIVLDRPADAPKVIATCPVFIMWPIVLPMALHGNVGVNVPDIESTVADRILDVVRERCPSGEVMPLMFAMPFNPIPGYPAVGTDVTAFERQTAAFARDRGARYLLVPTIQQWNQQRTDDPLGALLVPKNRISIAVRLMRLDSPATVGSFIFTNRSHITLNQSAMRLLNNNFRAMLRALLWGHEKTSSTKP